MHYRRNDNPAKKKIREIKSSEKYFELTEKFKMICNGPSSIQEFGGLLYFIGTWVDPIFCPLTSSFYLYSLQELVPGVE